MKISIQLVIFILSVFNLNSQSIIAIQSFENSGDTWMPLTFSTPPCSNNNDIWNYSTNLPGITASHGNHFWGIRDLDGNCGGSEFETITLPAVDISSVSNVIFSFDYNARNFNNNDDLKYELFYNGISQGEIIVVNGVIGNSDNTNGWKTETVSIPENVSSVSLKLSAKCNRNNEIAGFDNVKLSVSLPNNACLDALNLIVGNSNTENVVMSSNVGSTDSGILPIPNCGAYNGNDVWFTAQIPASGILNIETLNAGSNIDTAIAAYTGTCNNLIQLACDDDGGPGLYSTINLTGLPNITVYIRVWTYNNSTSGDFNIVAYTPLCPITSRWNGSRWNNGNPNSFTSTVINGDYDTAINGSFESCDCQINNNRTVNVRANDHITIHNDLNVIGSLEVRNNGSLVMKNDLGLVTVTGNLNVHRTTAPFNQFDYMYWSSPTSNETIGSALATSVPNRIYQFNTATFNENTPNSGWMQVAPSSTMIPGVGYIAMGPTTGTFPQTQDVIFNGTVNNGIIEVPIKLSQDSNNDDDDWNLIGNPYPSAIDADILLNNPLNTNIVGGTIYLWTHNTPIVNNPNGTDYTSNDYATYTIGTGGVAASSGGERPTGKIASGQSFFIQGLTEGMITFNNSIRVNTGNDQFFRTDVNKISQDEKNRIWLNLYNKSGAYSQILIGFMEGATDGIDQLYDGPKFGGGWTSFYSIVEGKDLVIQGKPMFKDRDELIPLGYSSFINEATDLIIGLDQVEGNLKSYHIYLRDNYLEVVHDLNISDYSFKQTETGNFKDRFELLIKGAGILNVEENELTDDVIIFSENNRLQIKTLNGSAILSLQAYDVLGKSIINESTNKNDIIVETSNIKKGTILFINVYLENNQKLTKKVILN